MTAGPLVVAEAVSRGVVGLAVVLGAVLALTGVGWGAAAPLVLVAGLLAGLPHGAVDHLAPTWRAGSAFVGGGGSGRRLAVLAAYAGLAAAAWAVLTRLPAVGWAAFVVLSVAHFGTGEASFARWRGSGRGWGAAATTLLAVVAGAVVVVLPVAAHPADAAAYLAALVPGWDGRVPATAAVAVAVAVLAGALAAGATLLRGGHAAAAGDLALVVGLVLVCPPAVAFGVWFGGWHAVRHGGLLVAEETRARGPGAGARCARAAVVPTLVAAAAVLALWQLSAGGDVHRFVATDLAVLAALTVPHAAVVWWLDRGRGGHWSGDGYRRAGAGSRAAA